MSSLLQSTFLHIIDISITTCAQFKLQLFIDPMPVAAGHHASKPCICLCHRAVQQRRRLYNASPAVAAQCSSGGSRRAAPQRPQPPLSSMHATIFSMLPLFAAQQVGDLKYMGRAGPGEGLGGIGGPGREGEGQLLNSIVVEALA
jgi:hypothetical protein